MFRISATRCITQPEKKNGVNARPKAIITMHIAIIRGLSLIILIMAKTGTEKSVATAIKKSNAESAIRRPLEPRDIIKRVKMGTNAASKLPRTAVARVATVHLGNFLDVSLITPNVQS